MKSDSTDNQEKKPRKETPESLTNTEMPICGVVMPIASMGGEYTENHWKDVFNIIKEAAKEAGYKAQLVSNSESVGIIHSDIVQNLYNNSIIICDVSGKNPNVMFELGMRLTFDKPTVIIKDDYTDYSFDISSIRHEGYPRDLRYNQIQDFKRRLTCKITETINACVNPKYSIFLKHFKDVQIKQPKLESEEVTLNEAILVEVKNINNRLSKLEYRNLPVSNIDPIFNDGKYIDSIKIKTNSGAVSFSISGTINSYYKIMSINEIEHTISLSQDQRFILYLSYLYRLIPELKDNIRDRSKIINDRFIEIEEGIIAEIIRKKKEDPA